VTIVPEAPVTSAGTGEHLVTEVGLDASAAFDIAPNELTRVIFLNYTAVNEAATAGNPDVVDTGSVDAVIVDNPGGDAGGAVPASDGGESVDQVVDGLDLPVTGVQPAQAGDGANVAELLNILSGALLIAAGMARRRSILSRS